MIQPESLLYHSYKKSYSQLGQDAIIIEILNRIGISNGFFIEVGAWDGIRLSNCRELFINGWSGLFIEANGEFYEKLASNYAAYPNIFTYHSYIRPDERDGETIVSILRKLSIDPEKVNVLCIDIDSLDYEIFNTLSFSPDVVLVESGMFWNMHIDTVVPIEFSNLYVQQPIRVIHRLATSKGYTPVCYFQDIFLVKEKYADKFAMIDNDPVRLYLDAFNFMDDGLRRFVLSTRERWEPIKSFETKYFNGKFNINPTMDPRL